MAKYVGKRVVPKHCGAWSKNKEYEMLSIVLDEASGESYISRRVVPAGTLLTDEYYWSICSLFSQQIADMGEEFEERQNQITQNNANTLAAIRQDNDSTEQAIKDDNAATKQHVDESLEETTEDLTGKVNNAMASLAEGRAQLNSTNDALTARMNSIVGGATSDTELLDARVDYLGKTYENLGQHLRVYEEDTEEKYKSIFDQNRNMIDLSSFTEGFYINQGSGEISSNAAHSVSDFIPIKPNTSYVYSNALGFYGSIRYCFFDAEKKYISGNMTETVFTTPASARYIRISDMTNYLAHDGQLEEGTEATEWVPYGKLVKDELINSYTKDEADALLLALRNRTIQPANTSFFWASKNLFDRDAVIWGYYINQGNGQVGTNAAHVCTDYLEIEPNTDYTFSGELGTALRIAFYNVDMLFLEGHYNSEGITPYTVHAPERAAYIRFSLYGTVFQRSEFQFEKGSEATVFTEYGSAHLLSEYAPVKDTFLLNLPAKLYALVGEELNIYFDNLVDGHDTDYVFNVDCNVGRQLERCYRLEPTEAGTYTISISATNREGVTVRKNSTLYVADTSAGTGVTRSLIVLGDSTTNNSIAVTKLNTNYATDVMNLETIGTRGRDANMHEGRSGWTFRAFFTVQTDSGAPDVFNPFFNPETETFDATYYFANSGIKKPDWFFINLGINDTFGYTLDSILEGVIDGLNSMCDAMIASIKEASPNTKIGVVLTIPPNYSQDAFGKAYKCGQTRARYKHNNVIWVDNLIRRYENREEEGIYLVPIHTNLDTKYNMGMETNYHNKRNTTMTYESPITNGGVHPVDSGYWQIADVYWFFLKNMEV